MCVTLLELIRWFAVAVTIQFFPSAIYKMANRRQANRPPPQLIEIDRRDRPSSIKANEAWKLYEKSLFVAGKLELRRKEVCITVYM
jgi:hypothetical protein